MLLKGCVFIIITVCQNLVERVKIVKGQDQGHTERKDDPQSLGTVRCGHALFISSILLPIYKAKLPNSKRIVLVPKCYVQIDSTFLN